LLHKLLSWNKTNHIGFAFLVLAYPGSHGKRAIKRVMMMMNKTNHIQNIAIHSKQNDKLSEELDNTSVDSTTTHTHTPI